MLSYCRRAITPLIRKHIDASHPPSPPPAHELKPYKSLENDVLTARIQAVRKHFGPQLLILGHHYQQDEVIALSDWRGDSYGLSQHAADSSDCRYIVFCGVHFMAETADILANRPEKLAERGGVRIPVMLPDLAAGCSMADMAGDPSNRRRLGSARRSDRHRTTSRPSRTSTRPPA